MTNKSGTTVFGTAAAVMQAPIGASTTVELVRQVGLAGGLGCFPCRPAAVLADQITELRKGYDGPFAVNFLGKADVEERLAVVLELDVPVVHWSWGVQQEAIARLRKAGRRCFAQVGSLSEAHTAERAGVELLVVQGQEAAGGLQGGEPLDELLGSVLRTTALPVVAAGGITTAAGVLRVRALGASGVMLGTAFVATHESDSHPVWIEQMIRATAIDTCVTDLFSEGDASYRQRVLRNRGVLEWEQAGCPGSGKRPGEGSVVAQYGEHAVTRYDDVPPLRGMIGDLDLLQMPAGMGVGAITARTTAAEVVAGISC